MVYHDSNDFEYVLSLRLNYFHKYNHNINKCIFATGDFNVAKYKAYNENTGQNTPVLCIE